MPTPLQPPHTVSNYLPPRYRDLLVMAAAAGDGRLIDQITDEIAKHWPMLVRQRTDARPQFVRHDYFAEVA